MTLRCAVLILAVAGTLGAEDLPTITLNDFPEYAVAGTPLKLTFTARNQGQAGLPGLRPTIRAMSNGGLFAKSNAIPGKDRGEYTATLTLPREGEWTIMIASGVNGGTLTLPPMKVIAPRTAAPPPFSPNTRGLRLFATKGCVACHRHIEVNPGQVVDAKLDLSGKRFPQDYLRKFLADPSVKPADMPNLKLKNDEIEALAAFINKLVSKDAKRGGVQ
jgi:mono/diheme cytochrome c family protein